MNKKGFTLMELLGVVTIIALISLIIIPNITKNLKEKKSLISETNMKILAQATDIYIQNNPGKYNYTYEANGSTYCIPIQSLINDGVLSTPFKDINGEEIDYTKMIKATYQAEYNSFEYENELLDNSQCTEIIQYTSKPHLSENMIPVIYNETTNKWEKADVNSHWYNYQEKKWANAVLVKEIKTEENSKSRTEYLNAPAKTEILEQDILAQFVWIPRFRYQLFDTNAEEINIAFENQTTQKTIGTKKGEWLTHPAFTQNNKELPGIWIAKYESSQENNNIIIKANQTPWTNINYNDLNEKSINMTNENNIYGLKKVNTHLITNSEWSAVAYLSNSKYGINEKIDASTNNVTGGSISTTGNKTGIFDMSGVTKEFVNTKDVEENMLGQALGETKNWYEENNTFKTNENKYITRGQTSIFNYNNSQMENIDTSFRIGLINNENFKQEYLIPIKVTFNPNGGQLTETEKDVYFNQKYGDLPTPTREGYTFMGWRGKNNAPEINIDNYLMYNYQYYTSDNIIDDYIRINGNNRTTTIDTSWRITSKSMCQCNQGDYVLSFDIRSKNGKLQQQITKKNGPTDGKTGIYEYDNNYELVNMVGNIDKSYTFENDGNWYRAELKITLDREISNTKIVIGNDIPNLYGIDSYIDIKNIQLEEGNEATPYEPYQIYTSDTIVNKTEDHTLYAIWHKN